MTDDPGRLPQIDAPPMPIAAYAGVGVVVLVLLLFAFGVFGGIPDTTRGQLLRAGAVLLAAGVLLAAYFAWRSQLPYRLPGTAEDGISYAIARLNERRSIVGSAWIWLLLPLVPGIAVLYAGAANVRGVGLAWALVGLLVVVLAFAAVVVTARRATATIDAQIVELEKQR